MWSMMGQKKFNAGFGEGKTAMEMPTYSQTFQIKSLTV
jgi:hypothetical protein